MDNFSSKEFTAEYEIELSGGSLVPGEYNYTVLIFSDSISSFTKYLPSMPTINKSEKYEFRLNKIQQKSLWKVIEENNYFDLKKEFINNENIQDGFYYYFAIKTLAVKKQITVQNYDLLNTINIINEINQILPETYKFEY